MARLTTCDGCGEAISPRERETLRVLVQVTTLDGTRREELDLHGFGCLRRWVVDKEVAAAQATASPKLERVV